MRKIVLALMLPLAVCGFARAGTEYAEKSVKQAPPSPEWYADNELNVGLWGAYVFTQRIMIRIWICSVLPRAPAHPGFT